MQKRWVLEQNWSLKGAIELFQGLIWGIINLCRSNITWDMIQIQKLNFFKKWIFVHFFCQIVQISTFWKNSFFCFLIISQVVSNLQRHTVCQINPWNNSIAPFELHFCSKTYRFCTRGKGLCAIFFTQTLVWQDGHCHWLTQFLNAL